MKKEVLTTFEAADFCHTSYMSIKRWIWAGKLDAFKTPGGHFRIRRGDLIGFMRENDIPIPDDKPVSRKRVLVVDDDGSREGMANYLRVGSLDLEVATAGDSYETGVMVSLFRPDIILLDLMTPLLDGFSICGRIKKSPLTRAIHIIAMTGYGNEDNIRRAYACGADAVLFKPVELEALYEHIRAFI